MNTNHAHLSHVHAGLCDAPASFSLAALLPDCPLSCMPHDDCEIKIVFECNKPEPPLFGAATTSKFALNDDNSNGTDMETRISFDFEDILQPITGSFSIPFAFAPLSDAQVSENSAGQELLVSKLITHVHDEIESVSNLNACPEIEITFESDDAEPPLFDAFHTWSHAPMCFQDDDANKDAIATICGFEKTMLDHLADDLSQAMANSNDDMTDKSLLASLDLVQLFGCSFVMDDLPMPLPQDNEEFHPSKTASIT